MPTDLDNVLARLVLMQKDVFSGSDAVPVSFYSQEATPYWKNHIDNFSVELESEQLQVITYRLTMTLVLATVTQGFETEAEQMIHTWLPVILLYFGKRRKLKRTSADADVANLDPRGAIITGGRADYTVNSGIGQTMFALDFNIEVPMFQWTDQATF